MTETQIIRGEILAARVHRALLATWDERDAAACKADRLAGTIAPEATKATKAPKARGLPWYVMVPVVIVGIILGRIGFYFVAGLFS